MAFLHLPLTLSPEGFFEPSKSDEDTTGSRLRLFIYAGAGEYLKLPTFGIRKLWENLHTIGVSSRLCDSMKENERLQLEEVIRREVNEWLGVSELTVTKVTLIGDEREENGIKFRSGGREFKFTFHFMPTHQKNNSLIGPWVINESSYAVV